MIGRTNAIGVNSGGGVTTVDLPTHLASISASGGNAKATVNLTYTDTDYISGVEVRYKPGGYPTSPTDGNGVTADGAAEAIEITGLSNGTKYYFRVYLYREIDGVKYYQTDDTNAIATANPATVAINGITPAEEGENYVVIDTSGTFTISKSSGVTLTAYIVGGGEAGGDGDWEWESDDSMEYSNWVGNGGYGGYVLAQQLLDITESTLLTASIGSDYNYGATATDTMLSLGSAMYKSSSGERLNRNIVKSNGKNGPLTPYGNVGSTGGTGSSTRTTRYLGGIGAGNGGQCYYGGGYVSATPAKNYGCSGGGGGVFEASEQGKGSAGKKGCIIFTW